MATVTSLERAVEKDTVAFLATHEAYRQHLRPVAAAVAADRTTSWLESAKLIDEVDAAVWVTASWRDFDRVKDRGRCVVTEHGTGLQWYPHTQLAKFADAALIAAPNEFVAQRWRAGCPDTRVEIVGTPKMDELVKVPDRRDGTIAVSFHWSGRGTIPPLYRAALGELAANRKVLGHAHPRSFDSLVGYFTDLGIEPVREFEEVVARASTYVCDHSSTIYEWAALDRPVVILKRPTRMLANLTGLRYTDHADVGPTADPSTLCGLASEADQQRAGYAAQRQAATRELYPFLRHSTERFVNLIGELG